jgi:hypothetical protein
MAISFIGGTSRSTRREPPTMGKQSVAAASDKVYRLLSHGRWFSPGTPACSTNKTDRHDIAEILLKMALSIINQIKSNQIIHY